MTPLAAGLNLLMGLVYVAIGVLAVADLQRHRRERGFSHFGFGIAALAWTCGPHHLHHGWHLATEGWAAGPLDVVTVAVGLVPGAAWCLLRLEARAGGRGDRTVTGLPVWVESLPVAGGAYAVALTVAATSALAGGGAFDPVVVPNAALVVVYLVIAAKLLAAQLASHASTGRWSVSGLSLGGIFLTCAPMHAVYAVSVLSGRYAVSGLHAPLAGYVAVPAGLYFLWVVWSLQRGRVADWDVSAPRAAEGALEAPVPLDRLTARS